MSGQTLQKAFIPLPGRATAVYTSSGLSYYRHPDWLGSARFGSTPSRTMYSDVAYAPFGEPYAQAGATDLSFTGINQDTDSDSFDFPARQYSTQGRWSSPDPAGLAAVNPAFPQSWNRYPYVMNNPQIFTDPTGMVGQEDAISGHRDFWSSFAGGSFGLASIPVVSGYELYHGYCVGCSLAMWGINDPSLSIATPWGTIDDNQYWGLANVLIPNVVGNGVNLLPNLPLGPSQGGNVGSGPTPAEAATQYCEDHGQITRVVRGTDNVETTLSASFTIGPVNYNTKNEITPVIPAMPWPQWLSLGAGLDFGFNVPKGSAPSWNVGLGRNLGMSFYTNAQRKTTGFNINLGPSIGPPLSVSPGSTNACGLVNRNR